MIIGINEFSNGDVFELSKVWNELSDNMREVIAEAIGGKHSLSTVEGIMYELNKKRLEEPPVESIVEKGIKLVNHNEPILTNEQILMFGSLAKSIDSINKCIKKSINDIKNTDDDLTDLNKEDETE